MERVEGAVEYKLTYDKIINYFNEPTIKQGNAVKAGCIIARRVNSAVALYVAGLVVNIFVLFPLSPLLLLSLFSLLPLPAASLRHWRTKM